MTRFILTLCLFGVLFFGGTAKAMTVFDPTNYAENLLAAQEAVKQTQNMIEQLKTQIQQYERMLKDALSLPNFISGDLRQYITNLEKMQKDVLSKINGLFGGSGGGGRIEDVMKEFLTPSEVKNNPSMFAERDAYPELVRSEVAGNELTKSYADATLTVVQQQLDNAPNIQERFDKILSSTQGAEGQMQVMQAQVEMLSVIVEMLGQIHQLIYAQASMEAARQATLTAQETRERMMSAIISGESVLLKSEIDSAGKEYLFFK